MFLGSRQAPRFLATTVSGRVKGAMCFPFAFFLACFY